MIQHDHLVHAWSYDPARQVAGANIYLPGGGTTSLDYTHNWPHHSNGNLPHDG